MLARNPVLGREEFLITVKVSEATQRLKSRPLRMETIRRGGFFRVNAGRRLNDILVYE